MFLIQTVMGELVHDFTFTLHEALRYHAWANRNYHTYTHSSHALREPGWIPVGSVEFVQDYLKDAYDLTVKPRNVPRELWPRKFSGRAITNPSFTGTPDLSEVRLHVKSNDKIKQEIDLTKVPPGNYQISPLQEYSSEWRAFVWRGDLVGLQNYAGDFTEFPDVPLIHEMMDAFSPSAPCAYTLDVGIIAGYSRTYVVEVHDFFSCGLYGFADLQLLPLMLGGWFTEFLRENK